MRKSYMFIVVLFAALASLASFSPSGFGHSDGPAIRTAEAYAPLAKFRILNVSYADEVAAPALPVPAASGLPAVNPVDFSLPNVDLAPLLIQLATNWKSLGVLGILIIVSLLTVQILKQFVPENFKYKRIIVLGVSIVYSILAGVVVPGSNVLSVIVSVFLTSGGAIALFEALKGLGLFKPKAA